MVEEHQSKNFLELLNRLVLVEQKIVTVAFLLRSTPLNVFQTQSLLTRFLEFNSNVTANYYLLGPLKAELGKKHCAIVKGDQLADAKRRLAKVDICNVFSVQTKRTDCESLGDVFRTDWYDQKVPSLSKGFLKNSKAPSEFRSLSPIRSPPNHKKEEGKEVNEEDDREAEENATEVKKATGAKTLIRRPISFTPICKEEEQKQHFEAALALRDWVRNKIRESANSENGRFEEAEGEEDDDTDEVPPLPKVPAKKAENSLLKRKSAKSSSSKNRKRPKVTHSHKALVPQAKTNGNSIDGTNTEKRGSASASSTAAAAKNDGSIPMEDFVLPAQIKEIVPKTDAAEAPLLISEVDDGGTAIEEGPKNDGPSEGSGTDETEEKRRSAPPQLTKECLPTMVTGRYREDLIFYTPKARAKIREKEMQRLSSGSSRRKQIFSSLELTESDAISLVGSSTSSSKDQQKTDSDDKSVPPPPKPKDLGQVPVYLTEHQRDLFFKPLKPLFNLNTVDDGFWQCGECGEVLKNIRDGRRHMVSHIRVMRMRCSLCDAGAFFCSDMRVHLMYRHCDKLNLAPDDFISPGTPCMSREKADLLTQLVDPYHPGRVMYTTGKIVSWANPKAYFPDPKSERNILGPALPGY